MSFIRPAPEITHIDCLRGNWKHVLNYGMCLTCKNWPCLNTLEYPTGRSWWNTQVLLAKMFPERNGIIFWKPNWWDCLGRVGQGQEMGVGGRSPRYREKPRCPPQPDPALCCLQVLVRWHLRRGQPVILWVGWSLRLESEPQTPSGKVNRRFVLCTSLPPLPQKLPIHYHATRCPVTGDQELLATTASSGAV